MPNVTVDYTDKEGYRWRVSLPKPDMPPERGLILSVDFPTITSFLGLDDTLGVKMQRALWDMGVITRDDYFKAGIHRKVMTAYLQATGSDKRTAKYATDRLVTLVRSSD